MHLPPRSGPEPAVLWRLSKQDFDDDDDFCPCFYQRVQISQLLIAVHLVEYAETNLPYVVCNLTMSS